MYRFMSTIDGHCNVHNRSLQALSTPLALDSCYDRYALWRTSLFHVLGVLLEVT